MTVALRANAQKLVTASLDTFARSVATRSCFLTSTCCNTKAQGDPGKSQTLSRIRKPVQQTPSITRRPFSSSSHCDAKKRSGSGKQNAGTSPSKPKELTWRDYDPAGGLPIPKGDLPKNELDKIFSEKIADADTGNWIIRLMNWRRQSGALIDQGIKFPTDLGISPKQAYDALIYLRTTYPNFDEKAAGVAWADAQIDEISAEYIARSQKLGIYKKDAPEDEEPTAAAQGSEDLYGPSELVAMRRANEARAKAEEEERRRKQEAEEAAEMERLCAEGVAKAAQTGSKVAAQGVNSSLVKDSKDGGMNAGPTVSPDPSGDKGSDGILGVGATSSATLARPVVRKEWVKRQEERATIIHHTEPTKSKFRLLFPSLVFTIATLAGSYLLAVAYSPPPASARMFPDIPPGLATIGLLIGLNVSVFLLYRIPYLWKFFNTYFISIAIAPRAASNLLSTFTHVHFGHMFFNMILLYAFGTYLHEDVGRGTTLATYIGCGTLATFLALTTHVLRSRWAVYQYGSSGAVYAVIAAACLLRHDAEWRVLGLVDVPFTGALVLAGFVLAEAGLFLYGGRAARNVGYEAHVAGWLSGAAVAGAVRWRAERERIRMIRSGEEMGRSDVGGPAGPEGDRSVG